MGRYRGGMERTREVHEIRAATVDLFARHSDWEHRRQALRESLCELDADVLALQELVVGGGADTARELLGEGYQLPHRTTGLVSGRAHRGASVASR